MSQVNSSDFTLISSSDDVIGTYDGAGGDSKMGVEVELAFFDAENPALPPMNVAQNEALHEAMAKQGDHAWLRKEPSAETVEINSIAADFSHIKDVLDDTQDKIRRLMQAAQDLGVKRSFFSDLPAMPKGV